MADDIVNEILAGIPVPEPQAEPSGDDPAALADGYRATDVGNSERLAFALRGRARYVASWGRWIVYRSGVWRLDHGDTHITEAAKQVPQDLIEMGADLDDGERKKLTDWAKRSESAKSIRNMVYLARGIGMVQVHHRELDSHPWLLNVLNGTLDLRTGELLEHDPRHLLTKQAPVTFDPDADSPLWDRCLEQWQSDPAMRDYLQRLIGSGATGYPVEEISINHGSGGNGKGKFFGAVAHVLGSDYVVIPDKSLLVAQRHQQHSTVKARLHGARLAVAGETDAGDRLDEASLKEITGGDLLEARRMREDPWQFAPSHTLVLHTNHTPRIRGGDEGIWRRVRLIPWEVTIPEADRDDRLHEKLAAESSGILNWIIEGAHAWHDHGLELPGHVAAATAAYRHNEDHVGRFIAERCQLGEDRSVSSSALRNAYELWCLAGGEKAWSAQAFGRHLNRQGFESTRAGPERTRTWTGLDLGNTP